MELFDNYAKKFDFNNDKVKRKYHHSYRVQVLCEIIAKDLGFEENDIRLASLCGIFHDIARFKQSTKFDTFDDSKSFDHGDVGADLFNDLFANDLDINFDVSKKIIKDNKYYQKIEKGLDSEMFDQYFKLIYRFLEVK